MIFWVGIILYLLSVGCSGPPPLEYEEGRLDDPTVLDPYVNDPTFRVSQRSGVNTDIPVIIAAHGFTAGSAEWEEFLDYVGGKEANNHAGSGVYVSVVVLGGHGRSTDDFRKAKWEDWAAPIVEEYNALVALGFENISIAGSSTAGALIVEKIRQDVFSIAPKHLFFIDALVTGRDKMLYLVPYVYEIIGDSKRTEITEEEKTRWYTISPKQALRELEALSSQVRKHLAEGVRLPNGTTCSIYQSKDDGVVDPISAYMLYKGLIQSNGKKPEFMAIESNKHVFTYLKYRKSYTDKDSENQKKVFDEMIQKAKQ